ncbi:hypothetical protein IV102_21365 [bacterium]|nr:hypothetical protein [bacterium]
MRIQEQPDKEQLLLLCSPLKSQPKKADIQKLVDYLKKTMPGDDLTSRVEEAARGVRGALISRREMPLSAGHTALLVEFQEPPVNPAHVGLFFLNQDVLVGFHLRFPRREKVRAEEFLRELAETIQLDAVPPTDVAQLGGPGHTQSSSSRKIPKLALPGGLVSWLPIALFLGCTSLPAYLGARAGFAAAALSASNVRAGAAAGAFQATTIGFACYGLLALVAICYFVACSPGGSGIMSLGMAALIVTIIGGLVGLVAALIAGALAAVGAYIGAGHGSQAAGVMAGLMASLGILATPALMRAMSNGRSRRYSLLPIPTAAVTRSLLQATF